MELDKQATRPAIIDCEFRLIRFWCHNPARHFMQTRFIQIGGIIWTLVYGGLIVWIYATEPRSFKEVATNSQVAAGVYEINQEKFNNALTLFRREQFRAARDEWSAADPAQKDPLTQFYIGYACYREGWGRVYYDDALFKQGLAAANRAIALAPNGTLVVDDPNLQMHSAAELKAELEQGTETGWKDVNPLKLFRQRK
jgi:hypothetical protein